MLLIIQILSKIMAQVKTAVVKDGTSTDKSIWQEGEEALDEEVICVQCVAVLWY